MNWTEPNATGLNWLWIEEETEERLRRAANTSILLTQSGHTFRKITLLIIREHSIAALNQNELWVHRLGLCPSHAVTAGQNIILPLSSVCVRLSFILFVFLTLCRSFSPNQTDFTPDLPSPSISLHLPFQFSTSSTSLISPLSNLYWISCSHGWSVPPPPSGLSHRQYSLLLTDIQQTFRKKWKCRRNILRSAHEWQTDHYLNHWNTNLLVDGQNLFNGSKLVKTRQTQQLTGAAALSSRPWAFCMWELKRAHLFCCTNEKFRHRGW